MKIIPEILCLLSVSAVLHGVELVRNGQLMFNGIVTPEKPVPVVAHAAKELAYHLKRAIGKSLPVIRENAVKPGGRYIYLGGCRANAGLEQMHPGWNEGIVKISSDRILIAGNDGSRAVFAPANSSGTAFAVYELLERYLGVRWIWPGEDGEVIPQCRNLKLPETTFAIKPLLRSSEWRNNPARKSQGWSSPEALERYHQTENLWLFRHRFSCDPRIMGGHAFRNYYEKYHKKHPEYFSLLPDGTRRSNPFRSRGRPQYVSMCVSNPDLVKLVVRNWARDTSRILNLNENDTPGECCCNACLAADHSPRSAEERRRAAKKLFDEQSPRWPYALGSLSDRYCLFFLAAQKEADKINPDHQIIGLIYANYSEPPTKEIKLNERIILRFCPPVMYPLTREKIDEYKRIWGGWARTGARLMFRPNFTLSGHYFPVQYHAEFYEMFTYAVRHNMYADDMDSLTGQYMVQGLVNYVIASLNHHPDKPLEEIKEEFYSFFGAAKEPIRQYFDYVTDLTMKKGFRDSVLEQAGLAEGGLGLARYLIRVGDSVFTPEVMAKCFGMLDAAAKTPGLDETAARRILMLRHGMTQLELAMAVEKEYRKAAQGEPLKKFYEEYAKLQEFRKSIEATCLINLGQLYYYDNLAWLKPIRENAWRKAKRK